jgi:hypothetical protein
MQEDVLSDAAPLRVEARCNQVQVPGIQAQLREFREGIPMMVVKHSFFDPSKFEEFSVYRVKDVT